MLDVHPPDHAAQGWRDFAVHIATIVVGLLIAVGLEQGVEALHRHEERTSLREDLLAEAERNVPKLEADIDSYASDEAWTQQVLHQLVQVRGTSGTAEIKLDARKVAELARKAPLRAVWPIAQANGKAALLPDAEAQMFARQDYEVEEFYKAVDALTKPLDALVAIGARLEITLQPGDTLRLSLADREELARATSEVLAALNDVRIFSARALGAAEAVAHHAHTRDDMDEYILRAFAKHGER